MDAVAAFFTGFTTGSISGGWAGIQIANGYYQRFGYIPRPAEAQIACPVGTIPMFNNTLPPYICVVPTLTTPTPTLITIDIPKVVEVEVPATPIRHPFDLLGFFLTSSKDEVVFLYNQLSLLCQLVTLGLILLAVWTKLLFPRFTASMGTQTAPGPVYISNGMQTTPFNTTTGMQTVASQFNVSSIGVQTITSQFNTSTGVQTTASQLSTSPGSQTLDTHFTISTISSVETDPAEVAAPKTSKFNFSSAPQIDFGPTSIFASQLFSSGAHEKFLASRQDQNQSIAPLTSNSFWGVTSNSETVGYRKTKADLTEPSMSLD